MKWLGDTKIDQTQQEVAPALLAVVVRFVGVRKGRERRAR